MSDKHRFQIRMDKELFEKLKVLAEMEHRSVSAQIQSMLNDGIKKKESEK